MGDPRESPRARILFAIVLVAAIAIGCAQSPPPQQEPVKIGIISYLTGSDYTSAGHAFLRGAQLAVDELNAQGGLLGRRVELVVDDDPSGDVARAVAPAQRQLDVERVSASMVPGFGPAMAISGLFEERAVPLFVLWDSNDQLEDAGEYLFPIGPGVEEAGEKAAEFLYETRGIRSVAIVKTNSAYSLDTARHFRARYEELGGEVRFDEAIDPAQVDSRATIAKALAMEPEGMYSPIEYNLDAFFRQLAELGADLTVHAGSAVTQQTIDASAGAMEGMYLGNGVAPESGITQRLRAAYRERHGEETDQLYFNALGYDAVMLFAEAVERAGTDDPAQVAEALYTIRDFSAASRERITIGASGSAPLIESVFQVRDGRMVLVEQ